MKRRYVLLYPEFFSGQFGILTEGVKIPSRITSSGLPVDAKLSHCDWDWNHKCPRLWFEHPSFNAGDDDRLEIVWQTMGTKR